MKMLEVINMAERDIQQEMDVRQQLTCTTGFIIHLGVDMSDLAEEGMKFITWTFAHNGRNYNIKPNKVMKRGTFFLEEL